MTEGTTRFEPGDIDRRILNDFQHGLPLQARPFAQMAEQIGTTEEVVLRSLQSLQESGVISRVGPVLQPNRVGVSTLAAMAVPNERLLEVADMVSAYPEVNHNYEREHVYNLWFVVTAGNERALMGVLDEIEWRSGIPVMDLPMLDDYFIDLGFPLEWE